MITIKSTYRIFNEFQEGLFYRIGIPIANQINKEYHTIVSGAIFVTVRNQIMNRRMVEFEYFRTL